MSADRPSAISGRAWGAFVCLMVGCFVARGVALACIIPPLEMWDEYQHVGYVALEAQTGATPIYPLARVPAGVVRAAVGFPQSPSAVEQLHASGGQTYPRFWAEWPGRPQPTTAAPPPLYEALHPPVYYRLMAPLWRACGGEVHLVRSVGALRIVNLLLGAAALGLIVSFLGVACRDRRDAMLLALWVGFQPMLLLDCVRVANDALALLLGTAAVVWALALPVRKGGGGELLHAAGLGAITGLAMVTKLTNLALAPFVVACFLPAVLTMRLSWRLRLAAIGLLLGAMLAIVAPLLIFNWRHYHLWAPVQQAFVLRERHLGWADAWLLLRGQGAVLLPSWGWRWLVSDGLWMGGWSFLRPPLWLTVGFGGLLIAAALGWPLGWNFRRESNASGIFVSRRLLPAVLLLNALILAGLAWHAVTATLAWGNDGTWPWYAQVATPWLLAIVAASSTGYRNSRLRYTFTMAVPVWFVVTEWYGTGWILGPHAAQAPVGWKMLHRLAVLQPRFLGPRTLISAATVAAASTVLLLAWCVWMFWPEDWTTWKDLTEEPP